MLTRFAALELVLLLMQLSGVVDGRRGMVVHRLRLAMKCAAGIERGKHRALRYWRHAATVLTCLVAVGCTTMEELAIESGPGAKAAAGAVVLAYPRFDDRDPFDWTDHQPWSYPVHGIDVSKFQPRIDWPAARKSGVSFAFVKATEGGDLIDERFAENWRTAKASGIPRGAYHFYYFCRTGKEQARWFIRNVPKDRSALPPVLDMEWNHKSPTCRKRPPPAVVRAQMKDFLDEVTRHYGKRPIIYTTVDFFDRNGLAAFGDHQFWLRSVASHPDDRYGRHPFVFWQYSGTGTVPGIDGEVDLNLFNGTQAEWRAWLKANTS